MEDENLEYCVIFSIWKGQLFTDQQNASHIRYILNVEQLHFANKLYFEPKLISLRMNAMSLIHQKLYTFEYMVSISMAPYIRELADYLIDTFFDGNKTF